MRYRNPQPSPLSNRLRAAREARGLTQAALAAHSGAGRVTIARLEAGAAQDFRLGTLARIGKSLGLEIAAVPPGAAELQQRLLARERERSRLLDARRRHAALAARLLAMSAADARDALRRARSAVARWERDRLCSTHYISRWRALLSGSPKRAAQALLGHDDWTDALFQNTPWSFALEKPSG